MLGEAIELVDEKFWVVNDCLLFLSSPNSVSPRHAVQNALDPPILLDIFA